jgi:hypothetical protein
VSDLPGRAAGQLWFHNGAKRLVIWLTSWMAVATLAARKRAAVVIFLLCFLSAAVCQGNTATSGSERIVTLGNSAAALDRDWKFEPGDSPWVNGVPEWSQPNYDDTRWTVMDLEPKGGSVDPGMDTTGFVPGWTTRGYRNLSGYAWYRLRVIVRSSGQPLWLKMPLNVDDAYQVYANGRYVGQFGSFSKDHVSLYYTQPLSFPLPAPGQDGELALALRFYMSPSTPFISPDVGGMHAAPVVGLASPIRVMQEAEKDALLHTEFGPLLGALILLLAVPLALWAWLRNPQEHGYLWVLLALLCHILFNLQLVVASLSFALTIEGSTLLGLVILRPLLLPFWTMFWWNWFELQERRWIPTVAWALTGVAIGATFCANSPSMGLNFLPPYSLHWFNVASVCCGAGMGVLLLTVLVIGFRRDRTEALLTAIPIFLLEFAIFDSYLFSTFGIPFQFYPFGLEISVGDLADILMLIVVTALALRRFVRTEVREGIERKAIALDLEQARQLQQGVLIPETVASPCFTVETEYLPAQTVGGDFFQTLTKADGTLLIVIGDVSGKGMAAAMMVAVLVGAIRERAEDTFDPGIMLTQLNRRLLGRSGGHFATALAAELNPNGLMRIANAGHIPPYLNGNELALEGSLPLGIIGDAECELQTFKLKVGDRLTFVTDGVVEAANEAKELFGFERTREVSGESASTIAQKAKIFGQEDDITVLSVSIESLGFAAFGNDSGLLAPSEAGTKQDRRTWP